MKANNLHKIKYDKKTITPSVMLGQKVFVIKHFKDGPLFKASPKFEGPYRIVEILHLNKYRLRHITTGLEKIAHWNHLKLIKNDVDSAFVKRDESINETPIIPQNDSNDVIRSLRSRDILVTKT